MIAEPNVLVVDDEEVVCESCSRILTREGYKVMTTTDSRAGLQMAESGDYDAIILDVRMPELDGMAIVDRLGRRPLTVPVIIITGYGSVPSAVEALKKGVADYLEKPFTPETLTRSVSQVVRVRKREPREKAEPVEKRDVVSTELDSRFKFDVSARPGAENVKCCFACGTCTAACPVSAIDAEFDPRKIIRQVLLGMRKEVLSSPAIWRCVQCYACYAKCPQNVKFRDVMRVLREMAVEAGYAAPALIDEVAEVGELTVKVHRNLVAALLRDRGEYTQKKGKVEEVLGVDG